MLVSVAPILVSEEETRILVGRVLVRRRESVKPAEKLTRWRTWRGQITHHVPSAIVLGGL